MGFWLVVRYSPGHRHPRGTGNSGTLAPSGHSCARLSAVLCTESFPAHPSNFNSLAQSRPAETMTVLAGLGMPHFSSKLAE